MAELIQPPPLPGQAALNVLSRSLPVKRCHGDRDSAA